MKRQLRIAIDAHSVVGHWFKHSGWFASRMIDPVTLASFKPSFDDQHDFGERVSTMLGFKWHPQHSSFEPRPVHYPDFKCYALAADRRWQWLADNASGLWLPVTTTYTDDIGYYRQRCQIWFQDEGDATLFQILVAA